MHKAFGIALLSAILFLDKTLSALTEIKKR